MIPRPDFPYPEATYFDFSSSNFGHPKIRTSSIRVPVAELGINESFPDPTSAWHFRRAVIVFEDVARSEREIAELITVAGKGFRPPYEISDGPFPKVNKDLFVFYLAGPLTDPLGLRQIGWIEWYIAAASARIEDAIK
jgi:hypothetical protein